MDQSTMERHCKKCTLAINMHTELYTVCEGICGKSFHADCVGVRESDLCALSCNIIWICDPCMKIFCRMRERSFNDAATNTDLPRSIVDDVNDLKTTVAEIALTLSKVIQNQNSSVSHSTPISSPKIFDGTNDIISNTKLHERTESSKETSDHETEVFSLYLSNIDRRATEDDISLMVSKQLGATFPCYDVVKLIPKRRNTVSLDYVSFRIVLDKRLKPAAMTASTWPKGIKFREFVNRFNDSWKPS